jgi:hypothetical protein
MPHLDARALDADPDGLAALREALQPPSGRPPRRAPAWTPGSGMTLPEPAWTGGAPVAPALPPPAASRPAPGGPARRAG